MISSHSTTLTLYSFVATNLYTIENMDHNFSQFLSFLLKLNDGVRLYMKEKKTSANAKNRFSND